MIGLAAGILILIGLCYAGAQALNQRDPLVYVGFTLVAEQVHGRVGIFDHPYNNVLSSTYYRIVQIKDGEALFKPPLPDGTDRFDVVEFQSLFHQSFHKQFRLEIHPSRFTSTDYYVKWRLRALTPEP